MPRQAKEKAKAKAKEKALEEEAARNAQTSAKSCVFKKVPENQVSVAAENNISEESVVQEKQESGINESNACDQGKITSDTESINESNASGQEKVLPEVTRDIINDSSRKLAEGPVSLQPSQLDARKLQRVKGSNPADFDGRNPGQFQRPGGYGGVDSRRGSGQGWSRSGGSGRDDGVYQYQGGGGRGRGRGRGRGYEYQQGGREGGGGYERQGSVDESRRIDALGRHLSSVLRHRAPELGLKVRSDGYVAVKDLLNLSTKTPAGFPLHSHNVDDLKEAVKRDNKQRFGLWEENGQLMIRANQGHSIQIIKSDDLFQPIFSSEEVPVCVHGTYLKNLESIKKGGLNRMHRRHVHFATGLSKEEGVISGMRNNCEVLIHLNVQKALYDGMKLYRSENEVILTEGFGGVIPPEYFEKIEQVGKKRY